MWSRVLYLKGSTRGLFLDRDTDAACATRIERVILSGSGPSAYAPCDFDLEWVCDHMRAIKPALVLSGGAKGWDYWLTQCAFYEGFAYSIVLPSPDYGPHYWRDDATTFDRMLAHARSVEYAQPSHFGSDGRAGGANLDRNTVLACAGDVFLVNDSSDSRGTRHCIRQIELRGKGANIFYLPPF